MKLIFSNLLSLYLIKHCNGDNENEINDTGLTVSKNECLDICIQTSNCKNYVIKNGTCHFILTLLETSIIGKFRIKRKGGRGGFGGFGGGRGSFGGGRGASGARSNSFSASGTRGRSGGGGAFVLFSGNRNYDDAKDADFEKERKESILWILFLFWGALILMFCFKHGKKSKKELNPPHRYPPVPRHHQQNLAPMINEEKAYQEFSSPISIPTKPKHSQKHDSLIFEEEMFQEFCKHDSASSEPKIDIYYQKSSSPPPTYEDHIFLDFCQRNSIMPRQVSIVNETAGNETNQKNHHSFRTSEHRLNRDTSSHRF